MSRFAESDRGDDDPGARPPGCRATHRLGSSTWPTLIGIAIGVAGSGLVCDVISRPNTNGTRDRGWLQINEMHHFRPRPDF